jgi:ketosteroid isomerase-like protein
MLRTSDEVVDVARRTLLMTAVMAPAVAGGAAATQNDPAELPPDLARAVNAYDEATASNDVATLARLVADDYVLVNSDSTVQDKRSYLDDFKVPGFKLDRYEIEQPLRKVWNHGAVTGGLLPLSWTQDGQKHARLLRVAHVWIRQDGQWRLVYTQLTRIPQ